MPARFDEVYWEDVAQRMNPFPSVRQKKNGLGHLGRTVDLNQANEKQPKEFAQILHRCRNLVNVILDTF
jgi:hypothetical protein